MLRERQRLVGWLALLMIFQMHSLLGLLLLSLYTGLLKLRRYPLIQSGLSDLLKE
jgi:hypothetical protein